MIVIPSLESPAHLSRGRKIGEVGSLWRCYYWCHVLLLRIEMLSGMQQIYLLEQSECCLEISATESRDFLTELWCSDGTSFDGIHVRASSLQQSIHFSKTLQSHVKHTRYSLATTGEVLRIKLLFKAFWITSEIPLPRNTRNKRKLLSGILKNGA